MSDILPCPFCNGTPEYYIDDHYQDKHVIQCEDCGVEIRNEHSKEFVVQLWNTRFAPPEHAIVPLEPTDAMVYAGCFQTPYWELVSIYKTMIKIAQEDERFEGVNQTEVDQIKQERDELMMCLNDTRRLVRELDVALNGQGAAKQASLCDLVAQVSVAQESE